MHIKCTNCEKSFDIDEKLIPEKGRLLQCGNCNFKWFYKKEKTETDEIVKETSKKKIQINPIQNIKKNENELNKLKKKEKNNINLFKYFLVLVITLLAIIIIIDTFKSQIEIFFPNIEILLNNLYQSLIDVFLFFKDLIK